MPWFTELTSATPIAPEQILWRIVAAALFGGAVALIYRFSHGRAKDDSGAMLATLVLLSMLIAMVSMVIGDSVARAFSLVGALSIVRFRTVVEDTRDTAFVIFAVIVGMAAGANLLLLPLIGIPIVGSVALALSLVPARQLLLNTPESSLQVRLGLGRDPEKVLGAILQRHAETYRLVATSTARQGAALDLNYLVRLRTPAEMAQLVAELNTVEGVQSVELKM